MSIIDDDDEEDEQPPNQVYKLIKYSILVLCVLATAYRIYLNYQTYIQYKVIINSKVELNEQEVLPQLSVCLYEIISEKKLEAMDKELLKEYHSLIDDPAAFTGWIIEHFSLKTLFDLSLDYGDFFINCTYLAEDAIRERNCSDFYTMTLSTKKKCFNFFHRVRDQNSANYTYNRILLQNRPWVRIFVKKENLEHKKKIDIIINPFFSMPNTDKSNPGFKSFSTDYTQSIYVSYDCRKSKRLKKPYETECQDYTEFNYFDRQHCIYECEVRNLLYNGGSWTEDLTMNKTMATLVETLNVTFNYTNDMKSNCETDENKCSNLDCESKEYQIINKYHKLDVETISKEIEIRLYLNSAPTNSLEYEAVFPPGNTFVQLFIGPASLWLGLSIFSISKLIFWFLCEITNRKSKKKRTNFETTNFEDSHFEKVDKLGELSDLASYSKMGNYKTNYLPFYLSDNQLASNRKSNFNASRKDIKSSIDNYYNQLNKDLIRPDLKTISEDVEKDFNGPVIAKSSSVFNNPTIVNRNHPINSISQLSPSIYKAGLEMYPYRKGLKVKKTTDEVKRNEDDKDSKDLKDLKVMSNEKKNDEQVNDKSWIFKIMEQKNKLVNYFSTKRSDQKVYPNPVN